MPVSLKNIGLLLTREMLYVVKPIFKVAYRKIADLHFFNFVWHV